MKVLERIELLDRIGRELQGRMTYAQIDQYLSAHGVDCKDFEPSVNSKWVYVKELLADADEGFLILLADELEVDHNFSAVIKKEATFWKPGHIRLFLSHLASFKEKTAHLQEMLKRYAISSFVAHEDIEPSKEWQSEIEVALQTMDAMAVLLVPGFKESNWCDQEVGVAVGRDVLIIPVRKGLDPYGFIGKFQGIQALNKNVGQVAHEIYLALVTSPKTRSKMIRAISSSISQATDITDGIEMINLLFPITNIPGEILENMRKEISENQILMDSTEFIQKINEFLDKHSLETLDKGAILAAIDWDDIPF